MKLIYNIKDKPKFGQTIVFAIQQLLAIMAATLIVPMQVGNGMQPTAALFGAGVGTLVYVLFTKAKSPVFLGSSFTFIPSMAAAFAGAYSVSAGYFGLLIGAAFAALVYVGISIAVKFAGVKWIEKIMPKQVIGPTVSIIGLSMAASAVSNLQTGSFVNAETGEPTANYLICILCGLIALFVTILSSYYGKKGMKLVPFILGILAGYAAAAIFTVIGDACGNEALKIIDFSVFNGVRIFEIPEFTFITALKGVREIDGAYIFTIAVAYVPAAFVVFAEHIADHKNISTIVEKDLLVDPGLHRTLLGDGIGSFAGAVFGGCPNTTYGESIACVAVTKNASIVTIIAASVLAMLISFISPFVAFVNSIPSCVMGGVSMILYGFIAVSGLKMIKDVDLEDNKNLFVVSVILISGIGGLIFKFAVLNSTLTITDTATALILGIIVNLILSGKKKKIEDAEE